MLNQEQPEIPKPLDQLTPEEITRKACIGKLMTHTLKNLTDTYINKGFQWLLPVVLSQSTDPLWPDPHLSIEKRIEFEIYGKPVRTTTSMIMHKLAATSTVYPKLFILSPNIRIEKAERAKTGRHIYEFTQLDFEMVNASSKDVFTLVEEALITLIKNLKQDLKPELTTLGRLNDLKVPNTPFKIYDRTDLETKYGVDNWEADLINDLKEPAWITNIPRQFYDFEDFKTGRWDNYDLLLPQFGEVLSGSKRENDYQKIIKKIERDQVKKENYMRIIEMAKDGRLKPTAGAGIGIERLVGWIAGVKHIAECQPFPRAPGNVNEL
ncbi:asparagine synthetase A [Candidatus Bathycorpusculum sp.]|uniref:asparagine synthetase A n=1 Tax=Candidatus Bathycorpusculum sp. TaxID=2994959 RepID=UPI00281F978E|nr:asparagine synthetase A [Candidatus Termitimicrobium sp.]MCL2432637.1 asparagine synthetase A [Candidatus Termitimicrobium sp.]